MRRRAILIAASLKNVPALSISADRAAFNSFLRSSYGGGWSADEIYQTENSSRDEIITAIKAAKAADYCMIFFAGLGEIVKTELPWSEIRITLAAGEKISERELNSGSPRCAVILDCSRVPAQQHSTKARKQGFTLPEPSKNSEEFRAFYDDNVAAAESGFVKVFATATSSSVADAHSFTDHLLNECNAWLGKNTGALHLGDALKLAKEAMIRECPHHLVEYHGGRRLRHFPLAVRI